VKQTYVEFMYPGIMVSESSSKPVDNRDTENIEPSKGVYAFRFYDRLEAEIDGETVMGEKKNYSGFYYLNGKVVTIADLEENARPSDRILISNMRGNKWAKVIMMDNGQAFPWKEDDVLWEKRFVDGRLGELL